MNDSNNFLPSDDRLDNDLLDRTGAEHEADELAGDDSLRRELDEIDAVKAKRGGVPQMAAVPSRAEYQVVGLPGAKPEEPPVSKRGTDRGLGTIESDRPPPPDAADAAAAEVVVPPMGKGPARVAKHRRARNLGRGRAETNPPEEGEDPWADPPADEASDASSEVAEAAATPAPLPVEANALSAAAPAAPSPAIVVPSAGPLKHDPEALTLPKGSAFGPMTGEQLPVVAPGRGVLERTPEERLEEFESGLKEQEASLPQSERIHMFRDRERLATLDPKSKEYLDLVEKWLVKGVPLIPGARQTITDRQVSAVIAKRAEGERAERAHMKREAARARLGSDPEMGGSIGGLGAGDAVTAPPKKRDRAAVFGFALAALAFVVVLVWGIYTLTSRQPQNGTTSPTGNPTQSPGPGPTGAAHTDPIIAPITPATADTVPPTALEPSVKATASAPSTAKTSSVAPKTSSEARTPSTAEPSTSSKPNAWKPNW